MRTIALVAQKGGSGKSTIAIHLACAFQSHGFNTVMLDLDPQASAKEWHDAREEPLPHVASIVASRLAREAADYQDMGTDILILDTAPHSESTALDAIRMADLVIVPCQPSIMDIRAMGKTTSLLQLVPNKPAYAIMNAVQHHSIQAAQDAAVTIATHLKLPVAPVALGERVAFNRCLISGLAAQEMEPEGKAAKEIDYLYQWACKQLGIEERKAA
ncbi:AAA family ATPase [Methylobacterium sp. 1030]|uniref:AAA family ATPase n=1 Tax=Methylobacterium sp. 1030 TaxID=3156404 RepID=UPI00339A164C